MQRYRQSQATRRATIATEQNNNHNNNNVNGENQNHIQLLSEIRQIINMYHEQSELDEISVIPNLVGKLHKILNSNIVASVKYLKGLKEERIRSGMDSYLENDVKEHAQVVNMGFEPRNLSLMLNNNNGHDSDSKDNSDGNGKGERKLEIITLEETQEFMNQIEPFDERRIFRELGKYLEMKFDDLDLNDIDGNMAANNNINSNDDKMDTNKEEQLQQQGKMRNNSMDVDDEKSGNQIRRKTTRLMTLDGTRTQGQRMLRLLQRGKPHIIVLVGDDDQFTGLYFQDDTVEFTSEPGSDLFTLWSNGYEDPVNDIDWYTSPSSGSWDGKYLNFENTSNIEIDYYFYGSGNERSTYVNTDKEFLGNTITFASSWTHAYKRRQIESICCIN